MNDSQFAYTQQFNQAIESGYCEFITCLIRTTSSLIDLLKRRLRSSVQRGGLIHEPIF